MYSSPCLVWCLLATEKWPGITKPYSSIGPSLRVLFTCACHAIYSSFLVPQPLNATQIIPAHLVRKINL